MFNLFADRVCQKKKGAKSITFNFYICESVRANFEIKFLIVYRNCWLTLIFEKEIRFLETQKIFCSSATEYVS